MKKPIQRGRPARPAPSPAPALLTVRVVNGSMMLLAAAFALALWAYSPAMNGEFVFDDLHLPFLQTAALTIPFKQWLGVRPLMMATYWANLHLAGVRTFSYHLVNLLFHCGAGVLVYFVSKKILALAQIAQPLRNTLAVFCTAVFLLHPMQTEAVSYVAQRGESMGAVFFFAAWALFLYRREPTVTWPVAAGTLALYGAAVATKEHTVSLPAVLLLTDYFFHPQERGWAGIRRNWRLYVPLLAGALIGAVIIMRLLSRDANSAGFALKDFTWYQYFYTEWLAFFVYPVQFILPLWQTVDYDFPVAHTPFEHGAFFALLVILALLAAALRWQKLFPLASFGFLIFVVMLLPTSSVIPIKDVVADRRLYLPMIGLLFVCAECLRHFRYRTGFTVVLIAVLAFTTWTRNHVWASSLNLWEDAAQKSPGKERVQFGLAVADFQAGRCKESIEHFARSAQIESPDYTRLMDWSLAYECDHQTDQALAKMKESLRLKPSAPAWASMAVLYARQGKAPEAMDALMKGQVLDPGYPNTYLYRAKLHQAMDQVPEALQNLKQVLFLDPGNPAALQMVQQLQQRPH